MTNIVSFVLRREPTDLHTILRRGLGRAVFFARECYVPERDREILAHSLLHRNVYDNQIEPDRGQYLSEVTLATGDIAFFIPLLQQELAHLDRSDNRSQLVEVVCYLISKGVTELRPFLYDSLAVAVAAGNTTNVHELVELDGVKAFRFIAERLAPDASTLTELLTDDNNEIYPGQLGYYLAEHFGDDTAAIEVIAQLAREPGAVGVLATFVEKGMVKIRERKLPPIRQLPSYEQIKSFIETDPPGTYRSYIAWGKRLPEEVLSRFAEDMQQEDNPERIARYLHLLLNRPFPGDLYHLIEWTQHSHRKVSWMAASILRQSQHPAIRWHGLTQIAQGKIVEGFRLLAHNPGEEDAQWINSVEYPTSDEDDFHRYCWALTEYMEANPTATISPAVIRLYENSPCSRCREDAVRWLVDHDCLPEWIRTECEHDSYDEIRKLVSPLSKGVVLPDNRRK